MRLGLTFGGAGHLEGELTPACAAALGAVLEALGKKAGPQDVRTPVQRDHDALEEACRRLLAGKFVAAAAVAVAVAARQVVAGGRAASTGRRASRGEKHRAGQQAHHDATLFGRRCAYCGQPRFAMYPTTAGASARGEPKLTAALTTRLYVHPVPGWLAAYMFRQISSTWSVVIAPTTALAGFAWCTGALPRTRRRRARWQPPHSPRPAS